MAKHSNACKEHIRKLVNSLDIVQFDHSDFQNVNEAAFYAEADSFDKLSIPNKRIKSLFIRITSTGNITLDDLRAIGEKLSTKFPNAQIRWAFSVENKNMLQVLGI